MTVSCRHVNVPQHRAEQKLSSGLADYEQCFRFLVTHDAEKSP